jgi:hypothetical protein
MTEEGVVWECVAALEPFRLISGMLGPAFLPSPEYLKPFCQRAERAWNHRSSILLHRYRLGYPRRMTCRVSRF